MIEKQVKHHIDKLIDEKDISTINNILLDCKAEIQDIVDCWIREWYNDYRYFADIQIYIENQLKDIYDKKS